MIKILDHDNSLNSNIIQEIHFSNACKFLVETQNMEYIFEIKETIIPEIKKGGQ